MSDTGLRIRVDDQLRHEFIATCKARDTTAAQILRNFMRKYVEAPESLRSPEQKDYILSQINSRPKASSWLAAFEAELA